MVLFGGHARELIHVDKAFLIAAIQDARSWCHHSCGVETPAYRPGRKRRSPLSRVLPI